MTGCSSECRNGLKAEVPALRARESVSNARSHGRGAYIDVGAADANDSVTVSFPIQERTVTEMIGCVLYTLVIKGNEVVFIDPPGKYHPLYQRAHYRDNQTRWRKIERFISRERVKW